MSTKNSLYLHSQGALTRSGSDRIEIVRLIISEVRANRIARLKRKPSYRRQGSHGQRMDPVALSLQRFYPLASVNGAVYAPPGGVKRSTHVLTE